MAKFDMMEIKRKLDNEREVKPVHETLGQKILMVMVTAIALTMLYAFILTYDLSTMLEMAILVVFVVLVILRAIQVFRRKI